MVNNNENELFNLYSNIFCDEVEARNYLVQRNVLHSEISCHSCSTSCRTILDDKRIGGGYFKCKNNRCRKKYSLLQDSFFKDNKILLKEWLKSIFMFVSGFDVVQTDMHLEIGLTSFYMIKDKTINSINIDNFSRIGGEGIVVQVDETAICNGRIILNPSSSIDEIDGVQWIVGGVVEGSPSEIFLTLVPNRQSSTLLSVFLQYIEQGSIIRTDGYRSYPRAVHDFGSVHEIVNHSIGFRNEFGQTTNSVENLWSSFKGEYRARCGLRKERISLFIREFFWRKRVIKGRNANSISRGFVDILNRLSLDNIFN